MLGRRKFGNGFARADLTDVTDVRKKEVRQRIRKGGFNGCNGCQEEGRRKKIGGKIPCIN
ncbi:hypothetical protein [Microcoleus sp. OTE_8_concoct_300]|uniref:hypothetical protein n=1 Tax=Microcoleus sp. OTE_8_concoct_300 TaxID=2964710 RepID=UPI00403F3DA8